MYQEPYKFHYLLLSMYNFLHKTSFHSVLSQVSLVTQSNPILRYYRSPMDTSTFHNICQSLYKTYLATQ